jgi:pimeloyl-ACP methyl ester carboxylesterase
MGSALLSEDVDPPIGRFMTVDGTRLHYVERGTGAPVVLLHGNGSTIADFVSSGITERVARAGHRVITVDRHGFGYSDRPRGRTWGPSEQAHLLWRAFALLGIERPIVVGHSWGTLVALALALEGPEKVAGLVLLSGYYYPIPRAPFAFPIVDAVLWHSVMPFIGRAIALDAVRRIFAPNVVPERFKRDYSIPHALRPSQLQAVAEEAAMLMESAKTFSAFYKELSVPVRLIAGSDDRIVDTAKHSARLHRELGTSTFRNVPGSGHMVHHAAPEEVVAAITSMGERGTATRSWTRRNRVPRHWLHIEDNSEEPQRPAMRQH